jgi:predicted  nucleic acid-binding Zn-ribbon protein
MPLLAVSWTLNIGAMLSPLVGICILTALRYLWKRAEGKLDENRDSMNKKLDENRDAMNKKLDANKSAMDERFDRLENQVRQVDSAVKDHERDLMFLRERTAGLESAVFHRPPVLQEET